MKFPLPAIVVFLLSPTTCGQLLSPSPPNSVCDRKKTSLSGWLPLPHPQRNLQCPLLFVAPPDFSSALIPVR